MLYLNKQTDQQGAALIVLLFVMSLALSTYYLYTINHAKLKRARAQQTAQALGDAKAALMAWAVSNSVNLGQLPMPDRGRGGGYDGFSDCSPSGTIFRHPTSYRLLMGKLPVYGQTSPCVGQQVGLGLDGHAHLEHRFWYAVSRNVVHQYEYLSNDARSNPVINPSIIEQPSYPWLKVFDRHGQLLADRVAAVIIAPGDNVPAQRREDGAAPNHFLDSVVVNGVTYANHDYDQPDEDFVMGTGVATPHFNDQLVYITIDELMQAVNKRVMAESKWLLSQYALQRGMYPNAAEMSAEGVKNNIYAAGQSIAGYVPFDITDHCRCLSTTHCVCPFGVVASVAMRRQYGSWKSAEDNGACTSTLTTSRKTCSCTGAGSCSRRYANHITRFVCDADGHCRTENLAAGDKNQFTYTLAPFVDTHLVSHHCWLYRGKVKCNGLGDFAVGLNEADWLKNNQWPQYLYYIASTIQQPTTALLATTALPINNVNIQSSLAKLGRHDSDDAVQDNHAADHHVVVKVLP